MSRENATVDLTNCDREPIHQLGAIQDFGALIAVTGDWLVARSSTNTARLLGLPESVAPGMRLDTIFAADALRTLQRASSVLSAPDEVERLFGLDLLGDGRRFDCALHETGGLVVLEFEPAEGEEVDLQFRRIQPLIRELDANDRLEELCQKAAARLRDLVGFDRVMVYQFLPDDSGSVIAEARDEATEAFLGLRYPASDIPRQARALYVRSRFRIISDVDAPPVAIEPALSAAGEPLDLSLSTLRAVSPIHLEYLRNMGVAASLSISIVVRGELWGLFACHHATARVLPYPARVAAELFSELFSLMVERAQSQALANNDVMGRDLHDRLMRAVATGRPLIESLPDLRPIIERALPHDGASIFIDGTCESRGSAPSADQFRAIVPLLNAAAASRVVATDRLAERVPEAAAFADVAAGALIIPISRSPRDYFVLWRKELRQTVTWAGNPTKPVETSVHGDRLTPRKSFAAWEQTVEGRSREWSESERRVAESLRVTLLEVILRLTDEASQEQAKAQQKQELLIAELNHRVRNILNLIRGLINQSRHGAVGVEDFTDLIGGRISALATAHDNITRQNWSAAPLGDLIRSEANAYVGAKADRLTLTGDEVLISPEAYTVLALVIHEMITNSVKYGALCDRSGTLDIAVEADRSGMTLKWRESGGPPVKPPERRGFGSTIIEKSIPYELNGRTTLDYKLTGLEAEIWVPGRYITRTGMSAKSAVTEERAGEDKAALPADHAPERVLLVEDSMIIALDTEECLLALGVGQVIVEGTVAGALSALETGDFGAALLDFNLGTESSEKVADALRLRGIPFWLATGYGEIEAKVEVLGARGLLVKPYGKQELERILKELARPPS